MQGHSFDVAKQGYVNLLPAHHKRSRDPGDSKEMVAARRAFLNSGIYQPIASKLVNVVKVHLPDVVTTILDAGCGEGYYLEKIANGLQTERPNIQLAMGGLDISKWAVMAAAKRRPELTWIVASNRQIPIPDNSLDLLLCCFGFYSFKEFARVLKPKGKLVLVDAGIEHLIELREVIYPEVKRSGPLSLRTAEAMGFQQVATDALVHRTASIKHDKIQQLLTMTPHLYRAQAKGKKAANALTELRLTLDVCFRVLTLNATT